MRKIGVSRGCRREGRRGEGECKEEVNRREEVPFFFSVSNFPKPPWREGRVGQPCSSHWSSEDTQSCSGHCAGCWGHHNGPERWHPASGVHGGSAGGRPWATIPPNCVHVSVSVCSYVWLCVSLHKSTYGSAYMCKCMCVNAWMSVNEGMRIFIWAPVCTDE